VSITVHKMFLGNIVTEFVANVNNYLHVSRSRRVKIDFLLHFFPPVYDVEGKVVSHMFEILFTFWRW
jgi:hypothetical protein